MLKRMMALLLVLLLPVTALAELEFIREEKKFINFPAMDEWRGHFSSVKNWTIVTPDNLDEHLDLVLQRGDTEEEVRARFAGEHFLFEAYSTDLPQDACFRAEVYEDDLTRDVWHLKHLSTEERKALNDYILSGKLLPDRDIYTLSNKGSNESACINGYFTNYPPARLESGKIQFRFRNGRMYVFSYCVSGRLAGASRLYSNKEESQFSKTPMDLSADSSFRNKMLPSLPDYALDGDMPLMAMPGDLTLTGTVTKGSTVTAAVDGTAAKASVNKNGKFTVTLPLAENGVHEIALTVAHSKHTTRTMTYTVDVSDEVVPLTMTEWPEGEGVVGDNMVAGITAPNAQLAITLDGEACMTISADGDGLFSEKVKIPSKGEHTLQITASVDGLESTAAETAFYAEYATVEDGIKAFSNDLTTERIDTMSEDPWSYTDEKVKISVRIKDVTIVDTGLGLMCEYNPPSGVKHDETPLYLTVPGYAQCQLHENMIITVYGTVKGEYVIEDEFFPENRLWIDVEYGTYMVYR